MLPKPSSTDLLRYLADLGWDEVRREAPTSGRSSVAGVSADSESPGSNTGATSESENSTASRGAATLEELAQEASTCTRCDLAEGRRTVVFGSGDPRARLMFVGEGPGSEEDRRGLPFVGPAGELLTKIVTAIGWTRDRVYIANVVKCRPPGNREPTPDEVAACRGFLEAQIDLVRPEVLVLLGRTAAQTLLGLDGSLAKLRGHWYTVRGVPTRVTYHPAALLRNASFKRPTWEDMQLVRDRLEPAP